MRLKTFESKGIVDFARDFEALFDRGDFEGMTSYYTNDATLLAEETDTVEGLQAIREFWRTSCEKANASAIKRTIQVDKAFCSGALGYVLGQVRLDIPVVGPGLPTKLIRYATIWKKEEDGSWRIVVDISNTAAGI